MLEIGVIRENREGVLAGLKKKNVSPDQLELIDKIIVEDDNRKSTQTSLDNILSKINKISEEIGGLYKTGKTDDANAMKQTVATLKEETKTLESALKDSKDLLEEMIIQLPNLPHASVPVGKKAEDNEIFKAWDGPMPVLVEGSLPHWELAEKYNLISFKDGVTLTGSGFPVYKGKGARLQRALISFFLDEAVNAGYMEIQPPLMVNKESARATGQLPDKEGQMYHCEKDEFYLIPTAEVPLTNLYRDTILQKSDFPIKMTGYTPCFRREAGSYGSDVKGLNRLHQFDKIELVRIEHPDHSYDVLMEMVKHVEGLLQKLELPYRILRLCGGDMSFNSALTFDFETWSAAQERWLEVSSVSNFETFQSNRMKLRFRDDDGKTRLAHTLNGSALALARIVATLLENHQTSDGINIPAALRPYTGFDSI
ncbi:MAG TPA: serine--tRNA ligase [Saprospiraceae bacterium]|nr:serine--tRNA ligase [Saprospiraceae bacterium]MBK8887909.1 serine--tRNA ligase [Saprospiraceae bacterium]MBP6540123.1 serine--tRNA ligase [Saprospiraceae bacterium]HQV66237.1 serine--tRNA ligase [Saprospiraceae bacterium]HQV96390.1 serine--tRNA ligase [Saprospiraceae bacterium]